MKKFIVYRDEVYQQAVHINAETEKEAIEKVAEGEGVANYEDLDYKSTSDPDTWFTEEVKV